VRRALVTGAAQGIGKAIADELTQSGHLVAVCDKQPASETTAALYAQIDVSDRKALEHLFQQIQAEFGGLDILVNNAVKTIRKPLVDLTTEDVDATWSTTLWGVFHATQLAARMMIAQKTPGSIVNISSVLAHIPYVNSSPYNGAKAAVNQMTRTWALVRAPHRVRVNDFEPGWIDTPGERAFATEQQLYEEGAKLPLGRLGQPEEIAKAVAFLVSDDAAYITGSILRVDGGISLVR